MEARRMPKRIPIRRRWIRELIDRDIADAVTRGIVDELLVLNFGQRARGAVAIEPAPIEADGLGGSARRADGAVGNRDETGAAARIDVAALLDQLSVPRVMA